MTKMQNGKGLLDRRASGVLMHISSLPGKTGIGTFGREARSFVDFLKNTSQTYWQILPVGPTGMGDSPYQSFSTFAGNPYFIDFELLEDFDFELLEDFDFDFELLDNFDFELLDDFDFDFELLDNFDLELLDDFNFDFELLDSFDFELLEDFDFDFELLEYSSSELLESSSSELLDDSTR